MNCNSIIQIEGAELEPELRSVNASNNLKQLLK